MNHSITPSMAPEADLCPHRHQGLPSSTRPPEEQEAPILAHQARIDAARTQGLLMDPEDRVEPRFSYLWQPGYQNTPRGVQLGQGLGYRTGPPVSAQLS